jgi:hypothetical protein
MMNDAVILGQGVLFWVLVGLVLVCGMAVYGLIADWWEDVNGSEDDETDWPGP